MNTIIEKIRAEVERQREEIRPTDTGEMKVVGTPTQLEQGWLNALSWMEKVLDTLQEQPVKPSVEDAMKELDKKIAKATKSWKGVDVDKMLAECRGYDEQPVCEGLEEEINLAWEKLEKDYSPSALDKTIIIVSGLVGEKQFSNIARHFYELGRQSKPRIVFSKEVFDQYDREQFINAYKPKVCEGLEEEIQKYMSERWEFGCINPTTPVYLYDFTTDELKECARHFAQWQKERDEKELSEKIALVKGINELLRSVKED